MEEYAVLFEKKMRSRTVSSVAEVVHISTQVSEGLESVYVPIIIILRD